MEHMRHGDIVIYRVAVREKGTVAHYYGCEAVGSISAGKTLNMSGDPVTGVMAVYRRKDVATKVGPGRILLAKCENGPDEMNHLSRDLEKIYGPGDLVTGFSCQCETACALRKL
jgi:hypothetical protein